MLSLRDSWSWSGLSDCNEVVMGLLWRSVVFLCIGKVVRGPWFVGLVTPAARSAVRRGVVPPLRPAVLDPSCSVLDPTPVTRCAGITCARSICSALARCAGLACMSLYKNAFVLRGSWREVVSLLGVKC